VIVKVSAFVKQVPEVARAQLPDHLRRFQMLSMPWLAQVYYEDKLIHYELAKLPTRFGENTWELGLHFESRQPGVNKRLLTWFDRHLFEVRGALGDHWHAEQWDRGWAKLYTTFTYPTLDTELIEPTGTQLAAAITLLEPLRHIAAQSR